MEPATIAFAIPLYKQADKLKKYWLQILGAIIAGSVCSVAVVYLIANALHLDGAVMKSMLPQAATTAIALPLSKGIGGIQDITAFAVIFNAVIVYALGALFENLQSAASDRQRVGARNIRTCPRRRRRN